MMRSALHTLFLAILLSFSGRAHALDVVCTLPWLADITSRVAPQASVTTLSRGTEDPHYLSPTPALMSSLQQADLYVENGLNLELWSQRLLDGSGNPQIRSGQPGHVRASDGVPRLEVPTQLTRAQGDLHPDGNPHIWLDPLNAIIATSNIVAGLSRVDPANAATYTANGDAFVQELYRKLFGDDLVDFIGGESLERLARAGRLHEFLTAKGMEDRLGGWLGEVTQGQKVVFYHQSWAYFIDRFGLDLVGVIENRPGISPSAQHRDELAAAMTAQGATWIGVTSYYNDRVALALGEQVGATVHTLPGDVGGLPEASDYFSLIDTLVRELLR